MGFDMSNLLSVFETWAKRHATGKNWVGSCTDELLCCYQNIQCNFEQSIGTDKSHISYCKEGNIFDII